VYRRCRRHEIGKLSRNHEWNVVLRQRWPKTGRCRADFWTPPPRGSAPIPGGRALSVTLWQGSWMWHCLCSERDSHDDTRSSKYTDRWQGVVDAVSPDSRNDVVRVFVRWSGDCPGGHARRDSTLGRPGIRFAVWKELLRREAPSRATEMQSKRLQRVARPRPPLSRFPAQFTERRSAPSNHSQSKRRRRQASEPVSSMSIADGDGLFQLICAPQFACHRSLFNRGLD
jgi:hypothetical protein